MCIRDSQICKRRTSCQITGRRSSVFFRGQLKPKIPLVEIKLIVSLEPAKINVTQPIAVHIAQRSWKRLRIDFSTFSVDARQLTSAFCIAPASVLSMSDVLRVQRLPHAKTSKKQRFRTSKSKPGASWGPSGEQVRAPKQPSRAKKRV